MGYLGDEFLMRMFGERPPNSVFSPRRNYWAASPRLSLPSVSQRSVKRAKTILW